MATGRVLQFDQPRGYGFIAADDGGEDIFLHASVFDGDLDELAPGMKMEFEVMAGDRGRKAFAAHLINDLPATTAPAAPHPPIPSPPAPVAPPRHQVDARAEEQTCEVLSPAEFERELTELLLSSAPALTGQQILQVRRDLLEFAVNYGWVDR